MEKDDFIAERKKIRRQERLQRKEFSRMSKLEQDLVRKLPSSLVPGNVGKYYDVCWPFSYTVNFDFGANPTWNSFTPNPQVLNSAATPTGGLQTFQVTQEAAFIIGMISRKSFSGTTSGELAPLSVIFRDRQSTRQFMDIPIPIQQIAKKTPPTMWEVPLIIMPNAFIDVAVSCFLASGVSQPTLGVSNLSFTFSGYRTRTSDIDTVLSTVFGR
jgi:hypothetical protein